MRPFFRHVQTFLPRCPEARDLCQGSTIILAICAVLGAVSAIALLISRLSLPV